MRDLHPETSDAQIAHRIAELLKHPAQLTRLDTETSTWGYTLKWRALGIGKGHPGAIYGVIVNTSDWERFCEIVSRVLELRKRKPATLELASTETASGSGIAKPSATVHIGRSGRR